MEHALCISFTLISYFRMNAQEIKTQNTILTATHVMNKSSTLWFEHCATWFMHFNRLTFLYYKN